MKRCLRAQARQSVGFHSSMAALILSVLMLGGLCGCVTHPVNEPPTYPPLTLSAEDRIMVLAPHPDDEALGCGGVIQQALAMKLPVHVVFLTYGDNNELSFMINRKRPVLAPREVRQMGAMRHGEALRAGAALGLSPDQLVFLGYPDFGTLRIWLMYWNTCQPFQSMLTHVTEVPYADAFRPGAPYHAEDILADLTEQWRRFRPTKVFVSHPADHNPDHLALYLFTQVAFWNLEREMRPRLVPYLVHYGHWPEPRGWDPARTLIPPALLDNQVAWQSFPLSSDAILKKRRAIEAHQSQYAYSAKYLLSFDRSHELFGAFPPVRFRDLTQQDAHPMDEDDAAHTVPDLLNDEERILFTAVSQRFLCWEKDQLVLTVRFSRPLLELVQASVFCFGYRDDKPFAEMPKLHVKIGANHHECYDQHQKISSGAVTIGRRLNVVTLRIPMKALGDPQRLLMSATTYREQISMDFVSWRVVELR